MSNPEQYEDSIPDESGVDTISSMLIAGGTHDGLVALGVGLWWLGYGVSTASSFDLVRARVSSCVKGTTQAVGLTAEGPAIEYTDQPPQYTTAEHFAFEVAARAAEQRRGESQV